MMRKLTALLLCLLSPLALAQAVTCTITVTFTTTSVATPTANAANCGTGSNASACGYWYTDVILTGPSGATAQTLKPAGPYPYPAVFANVPAGTYSVSVEAIDWAVQPIYTSASVAAVCPPVAAPAQTYPQPGTPTVTVTSP
jgi:hypothetical protein